MPTLYDTMIKIGVDTSELNSGMAQAESAVDNFGNVAKGVFAGNLLYNGARRLGSAILGFAKDSIGTGMSFDAAMSRVQATMLKTSEEMTKEVGKVDTAYGHFEGNLREFAQFLGENTAFSATQAAEALNYMALAGYDTQQSMEMLPNVLSLAAAGGFDLARASDMVTDAQTAFGLTSKRTTQMVDEMAKAAATGNTSVEQLGDAFLTVGGLAKELNGGFVRLADGTTAPVDGVQELEIALVGMANAGIKGSEAGTHMRNMLMKLSGPAKEGTKQLEKMGVDVFDKVSGNMRSLSDIFRDLGDAMGEMSQQEKLQAIQDLFNARDVASAEALLSAVQQDWDEIGTSILNAKDAGSQMAGIQLDNLTGAMTLFRSALEGAQIAIADKLTPALSQFVGKGTGLLQDFTTIFRTKGLQSVIDYGIGFVRGLAGSIRNQLPQLIPVAMETIMAFSENLRGNVSRIVDAGIELLMSLATALIDNLPVFVQTIPTIVSNIAGIISDNAPKILLAVWNIIQMLVQSIIDNRQVIIDEIPKIIKAIFDVWTAINWLSLGSNLITEIGKGIKALITHLPNLLKSIGDTGVKLVKSINWAGLGSAIINFISGGIRGIFSSIPTLLRSIGTSAMSAFRNISWSSVGSAVIRFILSGLRSIGSTIASTLRSFGTSAMSSFRNINWASLGSNIISGIVGGLWSASGELFNSLRNLASNALSAAKEKLKIGSPSKVFEDEVGYWIPEGIAEGIDENKSVIDDALGSLFEPSEVDFMDDFEYDISKDNAISKGYSSDGNVKSVSDQELSQKMDTLISLLEYYLPKKNEVSILEVDRMLGALV